MNILLASDENYAPLLGVTLFSILENNKKDFNEINVYILDGGISQKNKRKIKSLCEDFNINTDLSFIKYDNLEDILGIKIKATIPLSSYARLFAASLLPTSIDKIIYLDSDALVVDSLKELWDCDISEYEFGAVLDIGPKYNNLLLDLPEDWEQYNAGFLLINLKKWREEDLEEKFLNMILEKKGKVFNNDQGILNVVCKNKIFTLKPHYNIRSPFFEVGYEKVLQWYGVDKYYSKELIEDALKNPIFIHLTQFVNGRPWFTNAENHPLRKLFDSYVERTEFKNEVYTEDNRHLRGKFFSFTYKYLPYSIVCGMFSVYRFLITAKIRLENKVKK